jgi:plasmid stabilization system protein ParE
MKIEWTEPAVTDLQGIRDYIGRDSEYYAARFVERAIEAVEILGKLPKMGRHVPESEDKNIRELLLHNYRIIYRAESERILILGVMHGARDFTQAQSRPWDVV